jgi:hypothetical protein
MTLSRASVAGLVFIALLALVVAAFIVASTYSGESTPVRQQCDLQLASEAGASSNVCLAPMTVTLSSSNSSSYIVPVLFMKPGTTATITILYHMVVNGNSGATGHSLPNVTSSSLPYALSVKTGGIAQNQVRFGNATLVSHKNNWYLYTYQVHASDNANGYYAILPPLYYGFYPALAVDSGSGQPNKTDLAMWGFSGIIQSGEFIVPSTIVATSSNIRVVNATVPSTPICPNSACSVIQHSGV